MSVDRAFKLKNEKMMVNAAWMMSNLMIDVAIQECPAFYEYHLIDTVFEEIEMHNSKVRLTRRNTIYLTFWTLHFRP